jgi:hypothetical protein
LLDVATEEYVHDTRESDNDSSVEGDSDDATDSPELDDALRLSVVIELDHTDSLDVMAVSKLQRVEIDADSDNMVVCVDEAFSKEVNIVELSTIAEDSIADGFEDEPAAADETVLAVLDTKMEESDIAIESGASELVVATERRARDEVVIHEGSIGVCDV